jgi:putative two-component system response regulator
MRAIRGGEILIVDSDATWVQNTVPTLEGNGHLVSKCGSLADARSLLQRRPVDVVLCATILPDGDGMSLCEFVKNNPEFPDAQRISFALMSAAPFMGPPPEIAQFETNKNVVSQRGGTLFGIGRRKPVEPPPPVEQRAATLPIAPVSAVAPVYFTNNEAPPDDVIVKTIPLVDLVVRVQILLRMRRYLDEITNAVATLMSVAEGIEEQDKRARGHCKRLSIMALELGVVMGCDDWQLTALERAAYLHDIGKVAVPGALIAKPDSLTPREMEIIQSHCIQGEKICMPLAALQPVLPIIRHHHERLDGTGYPDGLRGQDIPVLAQILSIPDIYDALRMWRPYRAPMYQQQAVAVMRQEVNQGFWNRHIFDAFVNNVLPGLDERLDTYHVLWPPAPK